MTVAWPEDGPDGIPIGRSLVVPPGLIHDDLREAIRVISQVHGVGDLPAIPMRMAQLPRSQSGTRVRRGQIVLSASTGEPSSILIEVSESHRVFAALHEVGHFLDFSGIGRPGRFESRQGEELAAWRLSVARSQAMVDLIEMAESGSDLVDQTHVAALLDPVEAWARSYAQYIVDRSGSSSLRASLLAFRTRSPGTVYYPQQWEDDDFEAIDASIEDVFRRLGWRRRPRS